MTNETGIILRLEEMPLNVQCYLSYKLESYYDFEGMTTYIIGDDEPFYRI